MKDRSSDVSGKYYLKKEKSPKKAAKIFTWATVAVVLICCAYSISSDKKDAAEKQAALEALQQEAEELEAKNADYEELLNEEDEREYMERVALELYGYGYPSERRFYDAARN